MAHGERSMLATVHPGTIRMSFVLIFALSKGVMPVRPNPAELLILGVSYEFELIVNAVGGGFLKYLDRAAQIEQMYALGYEEIDGGTRNFGKKMFLLRKMIFNREIFKADHPRLLQGCF
jgi:hypothetical protein